jgi:DNA-binding beta-propeller fold protein YncE
MNPKGLTRARKFMIGMGFAALLATLFLGQSALRSTAMAQNGLMAPRFEVDAQWPKLLPNGWVLGSPDGIRVDKDDHVWIVQSSPAGGAPPVLEFDQAGNLQRHWGGPGQGYEWPDSPTGIYIDYKGNVWIGGNGPNDSHILKFTKDGKFISQFGKKGARRNAGNSNDEASFGRVANIYVDPQTNEAYIADGYLNKRVAVIDADTGKMKRWWGAYGNKPDDKPLPVFDPSAPHAQQFHNTTCVTMSKDRTLYVCDGAGDRLQLFATDGTFIREEFFNKNTKNPGTVSDIAFDPEEPYLYMADGVNEQVKIIPPRSLRVNTAFGNAGRQPGQFLGLHSIATDSNGNIYTTETGGRRVQRFINLGVGPVYTRNQGALAISPTSK